MKFFRFFTWVSAMFLFACDAQSMDISPAPVAVMNSNLFLSVAVQQESLPKAPEDKNLSWLIHRGGWGDSPAYGTRIDSNHNEELFNNFSGGLNSEYAVLKELCNATFLQDFGKIENFAAAATENGMEYAIMNTLSPLALSNFGIKTSDDCVAYLVKQLSVLEKYPNHCSINGKPVIFVYNVSGFPPKEWKNILRKTRAAFPGKEFLFIGHRSVYHVLGQPDPQSYMTGVLDAFDGIMFWSSYTDLKLKNLALARQAMETLGKEKLVFWTASSGYWRPEKGMFVDPQGTRIWRDQLALCFTNHFDGLMIESWNDLEEHTQVAPARDAGGVLFELLKYYTAVSNHREYDAEDPGLLLTHSREVLLGDVLKVEVISLPVKSSRSIFRLELADEDGQVVYCSPEQSVSPDSAEAFTFSVPTRNLAECKRLDCRIVVDGRTIRTGSWITLRKSKLVNPWVRGVVLANVVPPDGISFSLRPSDEGHQVSLDIRHDVPLSRVDIYRGNQPVWSLDAERLNAQRKWVHRPVAVELDFRMPRVSEETKNRRGVLTVKDGALVRGFDKMGRSLVAAPDRAEWDDPPSLGRQFNVKVLVDADSGTAFSVDMPIIKKSFNFTLGEVRNKKRIEYKTSAHGRVWIREISHPVIWQYEPGALGTEVHERFVLPPTGDVFENEYYLRIVDQNGNTFRSDPAVVHSERRDREKAQWFWDEAVCARFAAKVSGMEQQELAWSFDGNPSRVYDDEQGGGVVALLGGGMYRAGHFEPDAVPSVVARGNERALRFDGSDYVQLDAGAFPQGAFEMELDVCPDSLGSERQVLFFTRLNLKLFLEPDGQVGVELKRLADMPHPMELVSQEKIVPNRWSRIGVRYDYQTLTVDVNGKKTSVPLEKGPARDVSAESYLGAQVEGTQNTHASHFFTGKLDNLKIRCGASTNGR